MSASAVDVRTIVYSRSSPEGIKLVTRPPASLPTGSDKVLCRVVCAGINPVDAKGLVGDKVFTVCEWAVFPRDPHMYADRFSPLCN